MYKGGQIKIWSLANLRLYYKWGFPKMVDIPKWMVYNGKSN